MRLTTNSIELLIEGLDYLLLDLNNQIAICPDTELYKEELAEYKRN